MSRPQGVVLAGDPGANLYPLTDRVPKPLLRVANKPLIAYALEALLRCHVSDITVVVGAAARAEVEAYLRRGFQPEKDRRARIACVAVEEAAHSARALAQLHAKGLITRDAVVLAGDLLTDCSLHDLIDCHERRGNDVTLAVCEQADSQLLLFKDADSGHLLKMAAADELRARGARFPAVLQRRHPRAVVGGRQALCHAFVLRPRVFALVEHLAPRFHSFGGELLPFLVEHQFSAQLLRHAGGAPERLVLREFAARGLNRRVRTLNDFLQLNTEAVRWLGRPGALAASANNAGLPAAPRPTPGGSFFSEGCVVAAPEQTLGSFLQENCQLGAGTRCLNSLVMRDARVGENCLVRNSIIGAFTHVGAGSTVLDSTLGDHLSLRENSALEGETLAKGFDP